jgi:hypothetical protein
MDKSLLSKLIELIVADTMSGLLNRLHPASMAMVQTIKIVVRITNSFGKIYSPQKRLFSDVA